ATTRHITADFQQATSQPDTMLAASWGEGWGQSARTVDLWISTDVSPTIRQMRIQGSNPVAKTEVGPANSVAFSPDGNTLAVAHGHAQDWTVRVWDLTKPGSPPQKLAGTGGVFFSVAFSPDGKMLAAGTDTGGP